ncbi:MAG: hypothetical protein MUO39_06555 [Steroidobacteraceae bacterium]|nr:hypothetical protein [Steroidobacteraceae bacterium]
MLRTTLALGLLMACTGTALADATLRIDRIQAQQRARIEQGVASGQLTAPETRRLVHQERQLNRHQARVQADGVVTRGERYRLHRDAQRTSRAIFRQKHDPQRRH